MQDLLRIVEFVQTRRDIRVGETDAETQISEKKSYI